MTPHKLEKTGGLIEALRELEKLRTDFFVEGMDLEHFDEIVTAVRKVDLEAVAALHACRDSKMYPEYPESYQAGGDGYDAAEDRLRADIPKEEEL